ncbi:MAG: hypothetical protein ACFFD4_24780 [Candidatus Odinarchaeota archaeon]
MTEIIDILKTGVFKTDLTSMCRLALLGPHPILRLKNDKIFMHGALIKGLNLFVIHTDKILSMRGKHHLYYNIELNKVNFNQVESSVSGNEYLGYQSSSNIGTVFLIKEKGKLNESEKFLLDFGTASEYEDLVSVILESSINKYICVLNNSQKKVIFNYRINNIVDNGNENMKFIREPAYFILEEEGLFKDTDNWCFFDPKSLELSTAPHRKNGKTEPVAIIHLEPSSFDNLDS